MRIAIFHASAGHGHQKVAEAIREGLLDSGMRDSEIILKDVLDDTPAWFKTIYTSLYFNSVKHTPRLWGASYDLADHPTLYQNVVRYLRRFLNYLVTQRFVDFVRQEKPEAVVCTHFLSPEVIGQLKQKGLLHSFLLTVITDFIPHTFWANPGTDHYWVMSDEGKENLVRRGIAPEKITAGGIPVALRFRPTGQKKEIRKKEGLDPNRFTILMTGGSFGLGPYKEVLEEMQEFSDKIQVMVVSGRNEALRRTLESVKTGFPLKIYGFVSHMDELMEASDLMIAKPGGATTSESLAKGIPMIVLEPIPGQEAGNARLLKERNAAFFLGQPRDVRTILEGIFDYPKVLDEKRQSIEKLGKPEAAVRLAQFLLSKIRKGTS